MTVAKIVKTSYLSLTLYIYFHIKLFAAALNFALGLHQWFLPGNSVKYLEQNKLPYTRNKLELSSCTNVLIVFLLETEITLSKNVF